MLRGSVERSDWQTVDNLNVVYEKKWYLMQTKPNQHYRGLNNLIDRGHECYSPDIRVKHLKKGKWIDKTEPLFPGYVFIKLHKECNWFSVSSTRGIGRFIRFGTYPTVVPNKTIDIISENLKATEENIVEKKSFQPGDKVLVDDECFRHFEAVFDCEISNNRSVILIKYMEKVHEISIRNDKLKLIKKYDAKSRC